MASLAAVHASEVIQEAPASWNQKQRGNPDHLDNRVRGMSKVQWEMLAQVAQTLYNLQPYNGHPDGSNIRADGVGQGEG